MMPHSDSPRMAVSAVQVLVLILALSNTLMGGPVKVREEQNAVYLTNGDVTVGIQKANGELLNLRLGENGQWLHGRGHIGYLALGWRNLNPDPKEKTRVPVGRPEFKIIRDTPDLGEVSFRWPSGLEQPFDLDLRFQMRPDAKGFYVSEILQKPAGTPDSQIEFISWKMRCADALFNYRYLHDRLQGPLLSSELTRRVHEDPAANLMNETFRLPDGGVWAKHQWCMNDKLSPVHGITGEHVGVWFVRPSYESFGSVRPHNDCNAIHETVDGPILLMGFENNYYGRGALPVTEGFTKYNGPLFVYVNEGRDREAMWADAQREAAEQAEQWPFSWVNHPLYPRERGTVTGRMKIPGGNSAAGAWVILGDPASDWQSHKSPFLFFARADSIGRFSIPNVHAGRYTLYAWVRGVYGEFRQDGLSVQAGRTRDLGTLTWTPLTRGRLLWQIGIPDRDAREFKGGDTLQPPGETRPHWNNMLRYHSLFPNDVNFTIGKSREDEDWFYFHPAGLVDDPRYVEVQPPAPPLKEQKPIAWNIHFDLPGLPGRAAVLTLGFCSVRDTTLRVLVNGRETASLPFPYAESDSIGIRAGITGTWRERVIDIDPAMLHTGPNSITLVHQKPYWLKHVIYDFIRLEAQD